MRLLIYLPKLLVLVGIHVVNEVAVKDDRFLLGNNFHHVFSDLLHLILIVFYFLMAI